MLIISCRCTAAPAGPSQSHTGASTQAPAKHFSLLDSPVQTRGGRMGVDVLAHRNVRKEDEPNKLMKKNLLWEIWAIWTYIFQYNQGFFFQTDSSEMNSFHRVQSSLTSTFTALTPSFQSFPPLLSLLKDWKAPLPPCPDQIFKSKDKDMGDCECCLCPSLQANFLSRPFVVWLFHKCI